MSIADSLPNHTFTRQAQSSNQSTSIEHILSQETDSYYPSSENKAWFKNHIITIVVLNILNLCHADAKPTSNFQSIR